MITLSRSKYTKLWNKFWDETKKEWFKVEVLQDYSYEDSGPSLKAWLRGDKEKSIKLMLEEVDSNEWIKTAGNKQFKKIRIHITEKPYTPYLEWEIEAYKRINIPLTKEEVYIIDRNEVLDLNLPNGDFMIFDRKRVVRNYYDKSGKCYKMDFYEENDDIGKFLLLREKLLGKLNNSSKIPLTS